MKHESDWRGDHLIRCATPRLAAKEPPKKQPERKPADPDRIAKIAAHAAAGHSINETADALGLTYWTVAMCAQKNGVKFVNHRNSLRPSKRVTP
jgi:hypothetical protein